MAQGPLIDYSARFPLPAPPPDVWDAMARFDRFEGWWGWLSEFSLDGGELRPGAVLTGVVTPPVPYRMRIAVTLEECDLPHSIAAAVSGDLEGPARILLEPTPGRTGTTVSVDWSLEMMQPSMRLAARFALPMLQWGHDRVVEATVRSFRRQLLERSAG